MKIVINSDFGGFGLSDAAFERYLELKGIEFARVSKTFGFADYYKAGHIDEDDHYLSFYDITRNDPILVQVVEELGGEANGHYSSLKVVEIPDDVEWEIDEYDGMEHVAEKHRTWR
jgi:hypothetical protein